MFSLNDLYSIIDQIAPFEISKKIIDEGGYDNSGIIIYDHEKVENILFTLDLSFESLKRAKTLKCDTIITHHPAIYTPIKTIDDQGQSAIIKQAIKQGVNVISAHLNLDFAVQGIDFYLAKSQGATDIKVLEKPNYARGYGSEFALKNTTLLDLVKALKTNLKTQKVTVYGNKNLIIDKVASFCGGGSSTAVSMVEKGFTDANVIVTSDMAHHQIKQLVESGKAIILLTHYASENYGFNQFYAQVLSQLTGKVNAYYFEDKRFL